MTFPPSLMRLRVRTSQHRFGLWLPLFIMWPIFILLGIVLFPFVLIGAILFWRRGWARTLLLSGPLLLNMFCALRGLEVSVLQRGQRVLIYFV